MSICLCGRNETCDVCSPPKTISHDARVKKDIQQAYKDELLRVWSLNRLHAELAIITSLYDGYANAPETNQEELEWYSMAYNRVEEEIISRADD